jgi:hypothetical protein
VARSVLCLIDEEPLSGAASSIQRLGRRELPGQLVAERRRVGEREKLSPKLSPTIRNWVAIGEIATFIVATKKEPQAEYALGVLCCLKFRLILAGRRGALRGTGVPTGQRAE